jgi:hypothetical protein
MKILLTLAFIATLAFAEAKVYTLKTVEHAHRVMCNFYEDMIDKHSGTYLKSDIESTRAKSLDGVIYYTDLKLRSGCMPQYPKK